MVDLVGEGTPIEAPLQIIFPRAATVGDVDKLLAESTSGKEHSNLELDFSKSEFIEVASLTLLVATIAARKRHGLQTTIKLPDEKRTRDFLRIWKFPETIRWVTGMSFLRVAQKEEDRRYFGENAHPGEMEYSMRYVIDDGLRRLATTRFFSLQTYELTKRTANYGDEVYGGHARVVDQESGRWNGEVIKTVLEKQLNGPSGYVSSRIVFESMTNAVRHSKASYIVGGSMMVEPGLLTAQSTGMFTIVYWDDGDSMLYTLKEALHAGKPIKSPSISIPPDRFKLVIEKNEKELEKEIISSDFVPDKDTSDERVLLATVFPGITRDVTARGYASAEIKEKNPEYDAPGMGLHVLLNTVIDVFGGSVGIRTAKYFMSIKKGPQTEGVRYVAKIRIRPTSEANFVGNMLTIRLPVRPKSQ